MELDSPGSTVLLLGPLAGSTSAQPFPNRVILEDNYHEQS